MVQATQEARRQHDTLREQKGRIAQTQAEKRYIRRSEEVIVSDAREELKWRSGEEKRNRKDQDAFNRKLDVSGPQSEYGCDKGCNFPQATCQRDLGRCDCPPHRSGPACQYAARPNCRVNNQGGMASGVANETAFELRCDLPTLPCGCYLDCIRSFGRVGEDMPPFCFNVSAVAAISAGKQSLFNAPLVAVKDGKIREDAVITNCALSPKQTCEAAPWAKTFDQSAPCSSPRCVPILRDVHARLHVSSYVKHTNDTKYTVLSSKEEAMRSTLDAGCTKPTCGGNGICLHGRCECGQGFLLVNNECKPESNTALPPRCLSGCSERGVCDEGTCVCHHGYYGSDCSLSVDMNGTERLWEKAPRSHVPSPAIYVYNLPPRFNAHLLPPSSFWRHDGKGLAPMLFLDRLLSSQHRTSDPAQADYFFVGVAGSYAGDKGVADAIQYIQATYSYWNKTGGADHIFLVSADEGSCNGDTMSTIANSSIRLAYFGYHGANLTQNSEKCFHPDKDIVIPSFGFTKDIAEHSWEEQEPITRAIHPREVTLQFAGEIVDWDTEGSRARMITGQLNVRRMVYRMFKDVPGFEISIPEQHKENFYQMQQAVFCLAPAGKFGHWGRRIPLAALLGCIPVIIQDNYEQPFEKILPYERFAVRIDEADTRNLPSILKNISDANLLNMQRELACVASRFYWSTIFGPFREEQGIDKEDAFTTLMLILRSRLAGGNPSVGDDAIGFH
ncbi:hypothetical protein CYMTET_48099 [Cymbomonas tetramitiformis]|uniref:EGF-like domain-containing protein n=1 Tax=Cymbomonas tetramitiformis TaxID=36881 RepID=A0AAE0BTZ6_9CHLO|nr:hypothetical protein CYMTET_48099 [Cymbomonas tetramitiformis]